MGRTGFPIGSPWGSVRRLIPLVLSATALGACDTGSNEPGKGTPGFGARPNIVFILTDDLDLRSIEFMPRLKKEMVERGTAFSNYFVTVSLCCPSRSSILRGQYAHNHTIFTNGPPDGGFERFLELGLEDSTVATWLQAAGYRTIYLGKYLNGYPADDPTHVPPGWDEWHAPTGGGFYDNFKYDLNENGQLVKYGKAAEDYLTDVLSRKAAQFIREASSDARPFFIHLATAAPHGPSTPAPRHEGLFTNLTAPRVPSFDEEDVSDKPEWVRKLPRLSSTEGIDAAYRLRLQSLQAADEMIEALISVLAEVGELEKTYLVFSSDNGFHLGEHRIPSGKQTAYEEAIHLPLIVRGPGVSEGRAAPEMAFNIDLAPTFAELAGAKVPNFVDGRSLVPLLGASPPTRWRSAGLIEHRPHAGGSHIPEYSALRTLDSLYVEYVTGERELYDLRNDPYELDSFHASADPAEMSRLASRLAALRSCAAASCREADE